MSYCVNFDAYKPSNCAKWLDLLGRPSSSFVCDDADKGAVATVCQPGGVIKMQAANWDNTKNASVPYGPVLYPAPSKVAMAAAGVVGIGLVTFLLFR